MGDLDELHSKDSNVDEEDAHDEDEEADGHFDVEGWGEVDDG